MIRAADIGSLSSVLVDLNATGNNSSWRPKQVEVLNTVSGDYGIFKNDEQLMYYYYGSQELVQVGTGRGSWSRGGE
jgi:hypothetical protein